MSVSDSLIDYLDNSKTLSKCCTCCVFKLFSKHYINTGRPGAPDFITCDRQIRMIDMFMGFNDETFDFLWAIRFNNNRQWFLENKQLFLENVQRPVTELGEEVLAYMTEKHGLDIKLHISRIYRDARYNRGAGPYKDRLWFSLRRRAENWSQTPVFFFEVLPEGYTYGMGYYKAKPLTMRAFRNIIDEDPERFLSVISKLDMENRFEHYGEKYKRRKSTEEMAPLLAQWYDLKNIGVIARRPPGKEAYSSRLTEIVLDGYEALLPLYEFLWSLED